MKKTNINRLKQFSDTLDKIISFVSENKEILKEIYKLPLYNDEPKIFNYSAKYETKYKNVFEVASGVSFNKKLALLRVLGESLERYSIHKFKAKSISKTKLSEISKRGVYLNPTEISPFTQFQLKQKKIKKFAIKPDSYFTWTHAFSIKKNKKILVPSQLISFNYDKLDSEPEIMPINSTGTAFGLSFNDALYRAICEAVERDAFMISYLKKQKSPSVDLKYFKDKSINKILGILQRYNLELTVMDFTTDISIPVFGAIIIDRTGLGPAISIGLKAGWDVKNNIISAIEEALMTRSWIRDKFVYLSPNYKKPKEVISIEDRAKYWFSVDMIKKLDFWLDNKHIIKKNFSKNLNELEVTLNALLDNNMDIIYKDITSNKIKKGGFFVIRVIIPALQPLYLDERYKFLKNKRLYVSNFSKINTIPHPFL